MANEAVNRKVARYEPYRYLDNFLHPPQNPLHVPTWYESYFTFDFAKWGHYTQPSRQRQAGMTLSQQAVNNELRTQHFVSHVAVASMVSPALDRISRKSLEYIIRGQLQHYNAMKDAKQDGQKGIGFNGLPKQQCYLHSCQRDYRLMCAANGLRALLRLCPNCGGLQLRTNTEDTTCCTYMERWLHQRDVSQASLTFMDQQKAAHYCPVGCRLQACTSDQELLLHMLCLHCNQPEEYKLLVAWGFSLRQLKWLLKRLGISCPIVKQVYAFYTLIQEQTTPCQPLPVYHLGQAKLQAGYEATMPFFGPDVTTFERDEHGTRQPSNGLACEFLEDRTSQRVTLAYTKRYSHSKHAGLMHLLEACQYASRRVKDFDGYFPKLAALKFTKQQEYFNAVFEPIGPPLVERLQSQDHTAVLAAWLQLGSAIRAVDHLVDTHRIYPFDLSPHIFYEDPDGDGPLMLSQQLDFVDTEAVYGAASWLPRRLRAIYDGHQPERYK